MKGIRLPAPKRSRYRFRDTRRLARSHRPRILAMLDHDAQDRERMRFDQEVRAEVRFRGCYTVGTPDVARRPCTVSLVDNTFTPEKPRRERVPSSPVRVYTLGERFAYAAERGLIMRREDVEALRGKVLEFIKDRPNQSLTVLIVRSALALPCGARVGQIVRSALMHACEAGPKMKNKPIVYTYHQDGGSRPVVRESRPVYTIAAPFTDEGAGIVRVVLEIRVRVDPLLKERS